MSRKGINVSQFQQFLGKNRNCYDLLGVKRDAPDEEIRRSYRQKIRESHPDKSSDKSIEESQLINAAYAILSDSEMKKAYDALLPAQALNLATSEYEVRKPVERPEFERAFSSLKDQSFKDALRKYMDDKMPEGEEEMPCSSIVRFIYGGAVYLKNKTEKDNLASVTDDFNSNGGRAFIKEVFKIDDKEIIDFLNGYFECFTEINYGSGVYSLSNEEIEKAFDLESPIVFPREFLEYIKEKLPKIKKESDEKVLAAPGASVQNPSIPDEEQNIVRDSR